MLPVLPPEPAQVVFRVRSVTTADGTYGYRVFVPSRRGRGPTPAVLFLHGSGERGTDNEAQLKNGIRLFVAHENRGGPTRFPALVVAPQCRPDVRWTEPAMKRMAYAALDDALKEFGGDPRRVLLTGLSLGGYATWAWAREDPARWRAIAPVCGGLLGRGQVPEAGRPDPYSITADAIAGAGLPTWAFHGDADGAVPMGESRQLVAALLSRRARVRYSEYPGVGHNSWDRAYSEPDLLPWFLSVRG